MKKRIDKENTNHNQELQDIEKINTAIIKAIHGSKELPDELKKSITQNLSIIVRKIAYQSGPLPSPEVLQGYRKCGKDVLDHVLNGAKEEQRQRHRNLRKQLDVISESIKYNNETKRRLLLGAQRYATIITLSFLIASVILFMAGITAAAIGTLGASIVAVVSLLITGKKKEKKAPK